MLNFRGIVVTILKMETGRNFSMSGINSGHHNLPTYEMSLKSYNVEFVRYCGGHFENGDQQKFSNVAGFDINGCPMQVKCVFGQVKTAPNLSDRASENDSVTCSIPEDKMINIELFSVGSRAEFYLIKKLKEKRKKRKWKKRG